MTAFDVIVDNPFGSCGDEMLMPYPASRVAVDLGPADRGEHIVLCDHTHKDGRPLESCQRTLL
jgi:hypothetical protein